MSKNTHPLPVRLPVASAPPGGSLAAPGGQVIAPIEQQREVVTFLSRAESHGRSGDTVERIATHCSIVFLVGDRALKLKRAIAFADLDYSSAERRQAACRAELALNRRTAPRLYLAVRSVNRAADGTLTFDGPGPAIDWVVVMRRCRQADLFDHLAEIGQLTSAMLRGVAEEIARLHALAEIRPAHGGRAGLLTAIEDNHQLLLSYDRIFAQAEVEALYQLSCTSLQALAPLLEERRRSGHVRRGHGDLRLANICLFEGRPTLFDCIEFSEEIACADVLHDVAFLLMDLGQRGLPELAAEVLARYLALTDERAGLPALPLFISIRAATRAYAHAEATARQSTAEAAARRKSEAHAHFALALAIVRGPAPPFVNRLIAASRRGNARAARGPA